MATDGNLARYEIDESGEGERLDVFLTAQETDVSRTAIARQIKAGHVSVNGVRGRKIKPSLRLETGDVVETEFDLVRDEIAVPQPMSLTIVYEDECMLALDKPAGLTMHPANRQQTGTLANALSYHFAGLSTVQGPMRPGIVHRLDRETSGVVLIAKDDPTHVALSEQFRTRTVKKEYHAVVRGVPDLDADLIDAPLGPHKRYPTKRAVRLDTGKASQTLYQVAERYPGHALLHCFPRTGRTHQIRVHLAHAGFPIVGDKAYRGYDQRVAHLIDRHALHATSIEFEHPRDGTRRTIRVEPPEDFQRLVSQLRAGPTSNPAC